MRQPKTHCPYGHEYTPENSFIQNGVKSCKICRRRRDDERKQRRKIERAMKK